MSKQLVDARTSTILHVSAPEKFIPPFVDFLEEHLTDFSRHVFFVIGDQSSFPIQWRPNILFSSDFGKRRAYLELARQMCRAKKIVLHGLFNMRVVQLLAMQPWLLKKCYWVMWGGDLYCHELGERDLIWHKNELFRSFVIRRIGHFVTYIKGDYELAQKWYGAKGKHKECLMYLSNIYHEVDVPPKTGNAINILAGNSADPSNNHLDIFQNLLPYRDQAIRIYCPLSYGDPVHAQFVAKKGIEIFGDKFVPLTEFMPFDEYKKLLGQIDIAVFAHKRQQGMGNTISLLGLGKKVYMRSDVTQWDFFDEIGVKVFDICEFNVGELEWSDKVQNIIKLKKYFTEKKLLSQWVNIFIDKVF